MIKEISLWVLGNEEAANMFKQINRAYEVLSDGDKRQVYDQQGLEGLERLERYAEFTFNRYIWDLEEVTTARRVLRLELMFGSLWRNSILAQAEICPLLETYTARSAAVPEPRMAKPSNAQSATVKVL
jgi:curved DNA-binding protein CbpA